MCATSNYVRLDSKLCVMLLKRDPVDEDVPYCTLKSFPAIMDHCIEWARDKVLHRNVDSIHIFCIEIVLKYLVANIYVESCFVVAVLCVILYSSYVPNVSCCCTHCMLCTV